jgi:hypothetical protein
VRRECFYHPFIHSKFPDLDDAGVIRAGQRVKMMNENRVFTHDDSFPGRDLREFSVCFRKVKLNNEMVTHIAQPERG